MVDSLDKSREAVILIGDQSELLREQMKCDWNVITYCIIPLIFKDSK